MNLSKKEKKRLAQVVFGGASAPRTSGSGQKKVARRRSRGVQQQIRAPVSTGFVQNGSVRARMPSFGTAPAHDEFPEGGLRMSGCLPWIQAAKADFLGQGVSGSGNTGCLYETATTGPSLMQAISPTTGCTVSGVRAGSLHGDNSPIAVIAQFFRRFRYRKLWIEYETTSSTASTGTILVGYDREFLALADTMSSLSYVVPQSTASTAHSTRFPVWTPLIEVPLIEERKSTSSDELFINSAVGTRLGTASSNADWDRYTQGAWFALANTTSPTTGSAVLFGQYRIGFVLDLYGFANNTGDSGVVMRRLQPSLAACGQTGDADTAVRKKLEPPLQEEKTPLSGLEPTKLVRTDRIESPDGYVDLSLYARELTDLAELRKLKAARTLDTRETASNGVR